ncbi:MAG: phosphatase PAP2 family protein [Candidatus Vogelbacteria bacterium]|nr:phosphatase PAP2 family protein [Candidatus Vogelbacteria bacterium]
MAFFHALVGAEASNSPLTLLGHFDQALAFDHAMLDYLSLYSSPSLVSVAKVFTAFGEIEVAAILFAFIAAYLWRKKLHTWLLPYAIAVIGAQITTTVLKTLIARPRPVMAIASELTYSFPSGHATIAVTLFGFLGYIAYRETGRTSYLWLFGIFSFLVGISRIILGVHYPNDVLAGFAIGFVWILVGIRIYPPFSRVQSRVRLGL